MNLVADRLKEIIKKNSKVAIFPWTFPVEIDAQKLDNEFFKKGEKRYNRYIYELKKIGIDEKNITICNCYSDSNEKLKEIINNSDVILLPGGNPEMLF